VFESLGHLGSSLVAQNPGVAVAGNGGIGRSIAPPHPSVRFLGRRVDVGFVVLLKAALAW
jgi:hypothetical protein